MESSWIADFYAQLLVPTVVFAAKGSKFYANTLGPLLHAFRGLEDLKRLPIIDKSTVDRHRNEMLISPQPEDFIRFTSGTTTGRASLHYGCREEQEAYGQLRQALQPEEEVEQRPLILEFIHTGHGVPYLHPERPIIRVPAIYIVRSSVIAELLGRTFDFPNAESRISTIVMPLRWLKELTLRFLHADEDFAQLAVKRLVTTGGYLTRMWNRFLTQTWGAEIEDCYSLTEFPYNAGISCGSCGYYHFALPTVITEVVSAASRRTLHSGVGVLVLTGLFPFKQRQPMIRYWTGDLVEIGPVCQLRGEQGFRFKGRLNQALAVPDGDDSSFLLYGTDVREAADMFPDMLITPPPSVGPDTPSGHRIGYIQYDASAKELSGGRYRVTLDVGLAYWPALYPDRASFLRTSIASAIRDLNPQLDYGLTKGTLEFTVRLFPPDVLPTVKI